MTEATNGLRNALARSAAGTVVTLAEMSVADLIASMSDDQKAALAAELTPAANASTAPAAAATPKNDDGSDAEPDGDPDDSADPAKKQGKKAEANAFADANARALAVLNSEHFAGNENLAKMLLANDKLSASEITSALAAVAKPDASASADVNAAREEGERAGMQAAIASGQNSNIDAGGAPDAKAADKQNITNKWAKAYGVKE